MAAKKSILERIRANQVATHSKKVDAWSTGDDTFIAHWTALTLADRQKIQRHAQGDDQLTSLYTVVFKAQDEQGEMLFNISDKTELLKTVDSQGIEQLALAILGVDDEPTPEK